MFKRIFTALTRSAAHDSAKAKEHFNRGSTALQQGDNPAAAEHFAMAVECDPSMGDAYLNLALAWMNNHRISEAQNAAAKGLNVCPEMPALHIIYADVLVAQGRVDEGIAAYRRAIEVAQGGTEEIIDEARLSLANALIAASQAQASEVLLRDLLRRRPGARVILLETLGRALLAQNRLRESLVCADQALTVDPTNIPALNHRAKVLRVQGNVDGAISSYRKILALAPNFYQVRCNLGTALEVQGRHTQARAEYEACLRLLADQPTSPDYSTAAFNLAILDLKEGKFEGGWAGYEHRWNMPGFAANVRDLQQPLWLGDHDLNGRSILVYSEQGFGDTIQFIRYVEPLARLGAEIILEVQPPIRGVIEHSYRHLVRQVLARGEHLPDTDFRCPMMSLPYALKSTEDTIPARQGYLRAHEGRIAHWNLQMQSNDLKVGVVWSGSATHKNDAARSIPLKMFSSMFATRGCQFYVLQKDIRESDQSHLPATAHVRDLSGSLIDFGETAAIVANMDVVVSVDTSVAHLAAAMGVPTWILLPTFSDFRWLIDRADNPWYCSVQLYRQKIQGNWQAPLRQIQKALEQKALCASSSTTSEHP